MILNAIQLLVRRIDPIFPVGNNRPIRLHNKYE
jgi:hypothetical protein